jgi:DNA-binding MarR family transcriptional regulator
MEDNIGTVIAQVARLMRRSFDERARSIGVTRPQWQVLSLLARHEGINQGGLAEILEVEPITLGRMIDRLQEAALVERRPDPTDRRAWRLFMTEAGKDLIDQMRPLARETLATVLDGVDPAQHDLLMIALGRMRSNLSRKAPAAASNADVANG